MFVAHHNKKREKKKRERKRKKRKKKRKEKERKETKKFINLNLNFQEVFAALLSLNMST